MTRETAGLLFVLALLGAGWGSTQSLAKIAVSEGYMPFGLVFWQLAIGATLLGGLTYLRGRPLRFEPRHIRVYLVIALIGTILPNSASYRAAFHLPAGVISILLSLVPMFAFPIALGLGLERFAWGRFLGLCLGLSGVLLIVGPDASLPDRAMVAFIPLALVAPLFYGLEGNVVAKWGTEGLDAIQVLAGGSLIGAVIMLPVAQLSGQWIDPRAPWGAPDIALIIGATVHAAAYSGYVWLVGRAGPVFTLQVSYLVTAFGLFWAKLILGESYSGWVWAALALMFAGVLLVQPRGRNEALAAPDASGENARR